MKKHIAVLPGDGIGPEIIPQAIHVLGAVGELFGHSFSYDKGLIGAAAIRETCKPLPEDTLEICLKADAILFGCIGDPAFDNDPNNKVRPEQGLLALRKALDLYANIRPVKSYKLLYKASPLKEEVIKDVDFVVCRELSSGLYFGKPSERSDDGNAAVDTCHYSREEILRVTKLAFEYARLRKKRVTLVDKANVLATSQLWRDVVKEYAQGFPDVDFEMMFVDSAAMRIIQNPRHFDVILTENLFGDVLSDEASVITGSLGMLPSASLGTKTALYEPVHGSFPEAAGQDRANPLATILSVAMMLETSFNMYAESKAIIQAVEHAMVKGFVTEDLGGKHSCSEVGSFVVQQLRSELPVS